MVVVVTKPMGYNVDVMTIRYDIADDDDDDLI